MSCSQLCLCPSDLLLHAPEDRPLYLLPRSKQKPRTDQQMDRQDVSAEQETGGSQAMPAASGSSLPPGTIPVSGAEWWLREARWW